MREEIDDRTVDVRALWQSDTTDLRPYTPDELERKVGRLARRFHVTMYSIWAVCAVELIIFAVLAFQPSDVMRKAGALLTVAGIAFIAGQMGFHFVRMRRHHEAMIAEPAVVFYRAWLEQKRAWSRGRWFWSRLLVFAPGPLLFSFDIGRTLERGLAGYMVFILFIVTFIVAIVLNVVVGVRTANKRLAMLESFGRDD